MRTNLLSLFIPFIRLQLDVERLMYILAFNPVLFKLKLYVILNLALLTLARIKFSPLFAFTRLEFTDDRFKRIVITKIFVYIFLKLKDFNREHKNHYRTRVRSLVMLVTNSLTHSLTDSLTHSLLFSKLD